LKKAKRIVCHSEGIFSESKLIFRIKKILTE